MAGENKDAIAFVNDKDNEKDDDEEDEENNEYPAYNLTGLENKIMENLEQDQMRGRK